VTTVIDHPTDLLALVGTELGTTDWAEVDQNQVDLFASATGDRQWIHVDVERARAESPFGGPVAHGYLTLSLVNLFLPRLLEVRGAAMGVNVGLDKVRFPSPVPVGSRIRGRGTVTEASEQRGGVQVTVRVTIEVEGGSKPACVADTVSRFFPEQPPG
jgi:acyl dehydratase